MEYSLNQSNTESRVPFFSIITPTFNRMLDLEFAVKSVIEQDFSSWELLIIDNESSDQTIRMLKQFGDDRIKTFSTPRSGSIAKSRNIGISRAKGEWVAFLDSDDYWEKQKLSTIHKYTSEADVIYHDVFIENKVSGVKKRVRCRRVKKPVYRDLLLNGNTLVNSAVCVRRSTLNEIGGQNEDPKFFALEDYECWLRLSQITEKFMKIPKTLGTYCIHESNSGAQNSLEALLRALPGHLKQLNSRDMKKFISLYDYFELRKTYKSSDIVRIFKLCRSISLHGNFKIKLLAIITLIQYILTNAKEKLIGKIAI